MDPDPGAAQPKRGTPEPITRERLAELMEELRAAMKTAPKFPVAMKPEQMKTPPVPPRLAQVGKAVESVVKVSAVADPSKSCTNFFITEDGFLLTTSDVFPTDERGPCKDEIDIGARPMCHHIQDFETCGVSLSLLKNDRGHIAPSLKPDKQFDTLDEMILMPFGVYRGRFPEPLMIPGTSELGRSPTRN